MASHGGRCVTRGDESESRLRAMDITASKRMFA